MNKTKVEAMIKRSSLIVMIIAAVEAAIALLLVIMEYIELKSGKRMPDTFYNNIMPEVVEMLFNGIVYLVEMIIFFRIFRSGRPFTNGNIIAVRVIAALSFIGSIIRVLLVYRSGLPITSALFGSVFSVFGAVIFLFFAEIMRYGKLLQIESDETL